MWSASATSSGIVAKPKLGIYHTDGCETSGLKIRNRNYSRMKGSHELFESLSGHNGPSYKAPRFTLGLASD